MIRAFHLLVNIIKMSALCLFFVSGMLEALDKKFYILTASYNNINVYKRNLDSIFSQTYSNWELIYIDDISTDGTREAVPRYIREHGFEHKVKFVANTEKCYCLKNYYREIHKLPDDAVVVTLDGDDAFFDNDVLEYLNSVYSNPSVWCTYGNFKDEPQRPPKSQFILKPFPTNVISENKFRDVPWNIHHLRSFYAVLFKNIKLEDFLYEGDFIKVAEDLAYMFPIIEQCGFHHRFIEKVLCLYNTGNPLQANNVWRGRIVGNIIKFILKKPKYQALSNLSLKKRKEPGLVDLVLFNSSGPDPLAKCLKGIQEYMQDIASITVVYNNRKNLDGTYLRIMQNYPKIKFIQANNVYGPFLDNVLTRQPYVLFWSDLSVLSAPLSLQSPLAQLDKTGASAFYLNKDIIVKQNKIIKLEDGISAFQIAKDSRSVKNLDFMNIYRKSDIQKKFTIQACSYFLNTRNNLPAIIPKNKLALFIK